MKTHEAIQLCIENAQDAAAHPRGGIDHWDGWQQSMPPLSCRSNVLNFIACVAAGVAHGHLLYKDAQLYLNAAQLALSACPARRSPRGRKGQTA